MTGYERRLSFSLTNLKSQQAGKPEGLKDNPDMEQRHFKYERLPSNSIRVLTIHPSNDASSPIVCDVEAVPRDSGSDYTALSYTWAMNIGGDASLSRSITINGSAKFISRNLFEGLLRFRKNEQSYRMWIDAVCIAQDDDEEKTDQVSNMAMVYANASSTIVWLGEGQCSEDDAAAAAIMRCLAATYREAPHSHPEHSWRNPEGDLVSICALKDRYDWKSAPSALKRSVREAVQQCIKFLERRFFKRRWIVQELHYSKKDTICFRWGGQYCSETDIIDFVQSTTNEPTYRNLEVDLQSDIDQRDWLVRLALDTHNVVRRDRLRAYDALRAPLMMDLQLREDLTVVLDRCEDLECADPRDRLYALLSLDPSFGLKPDYSLSTAEVYTSFARLLLEKRLYMCIFSNLVEHRVGALAFGLPSWVPDLRHNRFSAPMERSADGSQNDDFSIILGDDSVLTYTPYLIGEVTSVLSLYDFTLLEVGGLMPITLTFSKGPWFGDSHGYLESGDLCCSTDKPSEHSAIIHILRRVKQGSVMYRVVRTVHLENESHEKLSHGQKRIRVSVV